MNKKKVIDELTKTQNEFFEIGTNLDLDQPNRDVAIGVYTGIGISKNFVDRLDEPTHDKCYEKMADYEKQIGELERQIEEIKDHEPKKIKVPLYAGNWIEYSKDEGWNFLRSIEEMTGPMGGSSVSSWFKNNSDKYAEAWSNDFEIEKEPRWIVKTSEEVWVKDITTNLYSSKVIDFCDDKRPALVFLDKKIAEAVALLVNGSVEEV